MVKPCNSYRYIPNRAIFKPHTPVLMAHNANTRQETVYNNDMQYISHLKQFAM